MAHSALRSSHPYPTKSPFSTFLMLNLKFCKKTQGFPKGPKGASLSPKSTADFLRARVFDLIIKPETSLHGSECALEIVNQGSWGESFFAPISQPASEMDIVIDCGWSLVAVIGEVRFLGIPKMSRQIVGPFTKLDGDDLMHDKGLEPCTGKTASSSRKEC